MVQLTRLSHWLLFSLSLTACMAEHSPEETKLRQKSIKFRLQLFKYFANIFFLFLQNNFHCFLLSHSQMSKYKSMFKIYKYVGYKEMKFYLNWILYALNIFFHGALCQCVLCMKANCCVRLEGTLSPVVNEKCICVDHSLKSEFITF